MLLAKKRTFGVIPIRAKYSIKWFCLVYLGSLCVPSTQQIFTPSFILSEKDRGHYIDKLRIIYTPTTQAK